MRCEDLMKRTVECVTQKDNVQVAARKMRDAEIGFLPVCDGGKRVVGAITDRDLALRVCAENRPAATTLVSDVMTKEVVACRPGDDITRAQQLMSQHHKSRMLCIDDGGQLVGVISLSDLAQAGDGSNAVSTMRAISEREARVR
jgi:CBS domain-containing protein